MGKKIDRLIIFSVFVTFAYAVFMHAFRHIGISCLLTFLCCAAIHRIGKGKNGRTAMSVFQARNLLDRWGYAPEEEAQAAIAELLGPIRGELVCIVRPLAFQVSKGDVFAQWKSHRGSKRLVIAATCYADGAAKSFAATLNSPAIELIDAAKLIHRIRRSNLEPPGHAPFKETMRRLRAAFSALPLRRTWKKNACSGAILMLLYLASGNPAYLFLSMAALFLSGIALRIA